MKLSKRLQTIANVVEKYKSGEVFGDIGTDHAYLPCYLVEKGIVELAYACDVKQGPLDSSKETISSCHLEGKVIPLLGDGIAPILDKKVNMICLAGMGSYLITEILDASKTYLNNVDVLFLQPNANIDYLREYLFNNNYVIVDEKILKDNNHIYEVLVTKKSEKKHSLYDEFDIKFGPILKALQPALFIEKWKKQYVVYQNIMKTLAPLSPRYKEIKHDMEMIEDVLNESL
ncbi:MAG: class I SAM-dependent methyltransferase [Thomasclavelia sp.]|nr:class I SAM-dependent methyltransferase [Thomasclavelia sp.]